MHDADGYEIVTHRIVYYAELGWCDGNGMGYWQKTAESTPFPTKELAQAHLDGHPDVEKVTFGGGWTEQRPKWPYGVARIDRRMELCQ